MTKHDNIMARLIAFLVVIFLVVLIFHLCSPEAKGQTPPMNPISYDWGVDPLGVYLNTLDTYRVLQQHEAEIDSNVAEIDTAQLEVDTLRLRVDSLRTIHESVFSACDTTGLQLIAVNDSAFINLDKEVIKASIYVHAADDYAVAVNEAGTYEISYQISIYAATTNTGVRNSLRWYSAAWKNIPGATMTCDVSTGGTSASAVVLWPLSAGDSLAVHVTNLSGASAFRTRVDGVDLTVKKLY